MLIKSSNIFSKTIVVILLTVVTKCSGKMVGGKWKWEKDALEFGKRQNTERGEKLTECLCPSNQPNDEVTFYCGADLNQFTNKPDICHPNVIYRCVGTSKKAISQTDCLAGSIDYPTKGLKCQKADCEVDKYYRDKCRYTKRRMCA